jgi:hypothetical protein
MIKNFGGPNWQIIANKFFATFQNNQVNYVNLQIHDNLNILKILSKFGYLVLDKYLKFTTQFSFSYSHPTNAYNLLDENFSNFFKKLEIFVEKSSNLRNNSH